MYSVVPTVRREMVLVSACLSYPARAATALLGALLLPALPIVPASQGHAGDRGPYPSRIASAEAAVARAYREAASASRTYQRTRRATDRQRGTAGRLTAALEEKRREYAALRKAVGSLAAGQYRTGGAGALLPGAQLMLSNSPERFLARTSSMTRGNRAAVQLAKTAQRTRSEVARKKAAADRALKRIKQRQALQQRIKQRIEAKLVRAEQRLRTLQTAGWSERSERSGQSGRSERSGFRTPVTIKGGCRTGKQPDGTEEPRSGWVPPVGAYQLTAGFAARGGHWSRGHTGQDFAVGTGTPVRAVGAGTVTNATCGGAFGHELLILHDNGYYTQYAHLSLIQVRPGQRVGTGEQIALSGSTGNSSGPHLHFEVRITPQYGSAADPVMWLRERGVRL